jgi:co-chaperonin GroES (HSP10)
MLGPNDLPYAVTGERCFIKVDPPKRRTVGGLEIPITAQVRAFSGQLIDAGLQARDKLRDHGYQIGDHVIFGKFAGIVEEWDHVIDGDDQQADDSYDWALESHQPGEPMIYKCRKTGALRAIEPAVVLNCDDLLASVELAHRRRSGDVEYTEAATTDGRMQHVVKERSEANGHA